MYAFSVAINSTDHAVFINNQSIIAGLVLFLSQILYFEGVLVWWLVDVNDVRPWQMAETFTLEQGWGAVVSAVATACSCLSSCSY